MKGLFLKRMAVCLCAAGVELAAVGFPGVAMGASVAGGSSDEDGNYYWGRQQVGYTNESGEIVYMPLENYGQNANALERILGTDDQVTLVIPEGETVYLDEVVDIGSNTTIIATGARIVQKKAGDGILKHEVDGYDYDAVKNVKIKGGHWYSEDNSLAATTFRFIHGKNIRIEDVEIDTNYAGHGITLVACKNVVVDGCRILAFNNSTKSFDSVEEALQIDVAAPNTAPNAGGGKYVKGQICKDITVKNCTLRGSRGLSANISKKYPEFYVNYHKNITITGCNIKGTSAEGVALFNAVGYTLKKNTIVSKGKNREGNHSDALHINLFGNNKTSKNYSNRIIGNTIKGDVHGINMWSFTKAKYGKTVVKKNTISTRVKDKSQAMLIRCCTKTVIKKNTIKK